MLTKWEKVVELPTKLHLIGNKGMLLLTGEYEHTIDSKGRLFLSNRLRNQIDSEEFGSTFYFHLGANGVLSLYPEKCFQQIALAAAPGTEAPDEAVLFERLSFAFAGKVELDRQGRLLINDKLRKRAGLGNELTLVGARDHIELWNTADWEQYISDNIGRYQQQSLDARKAVLLKQSREID